ncbi:GcrA family cell cycle regulator [Gluconobacter kondonii]|uniref:GcrA family cell cycle regulator n=1 Tax=Gluconobacter kondonii TaxID=941463 RepID=UPI001B8AF169|nr:GcrA family cell cycle regulator [Gluconobacter kondonii]MBS1065733.1 GcrA cell cycle regulator [Gluconobacter kondonii]MBS1083476.1 GcrA cell cycle regulator [Gluconobacter kondonii]
MEWTDETIARLRDLWSQGLSTAEIGRQLSITKNAVVGKAHRLGLPPRPSPIRNRKAADGEAGTTEAAPRRKSPSKAKAVEAAGSDLFAEGKDASGVVERTAETPARKAPSAPEAPKAPVQPVAAARVVSPVQKEAAAAPHREAPITPPKPEPRVAPAPRPAVPPRFSTAGIDRPTRRGPSCCWPIGDPGTPGFHFCGATPLPGKPYCAEHAAIAYVKIRDRRD